MPKVEKKGVWGHPLPVTIRLVGNNWLKINLSIDLIHTENLIGKVCWRIYRWSILIGTRGNWRLELVKNRHRTKFLPCIVKVGLCCSKSI